MRVVSLSIFLIFCFIEFSCGAEKKIVVASPPSPDAQFPDGPPVETIPIPNITEPTVFKCGRLETFRESNTCKENCHASLCSEKLVKNCFCKEGYCRDPATKKCVVKPVPPKIDCGCQRA